MIKIMKTAIIFLLPAILLGCSPGLFTKNDSSAPSFGPIFIGMIRADAEIHLGYPVFIKQINDSHYRIIYEYEIEKDVKDTIINDIMDFATSGMGVLIVSPVDRFKGNRHLMAIVYEMEDNYEENDRVVAITDRIKQDPMP